MLSKGRFSSSRVVAEYEAHITVGETVDHFAPQTQCCEGNMKGGGAASCSQDGNILEPLDNHYWQIKL